MTNRPNNDDPQAQDDWDLYLQVFLDESDEDLESLVQALLRLESDPDDVDSLNEAFRLLHTHKGSAGLMGFDGISDLAHQLESRFDQFRSGTVSLDGSRVTVFLRCVDFLRKFNERLRGGEIPEQDVSAILQTLENSDRQAEGDAGENQPAPTQSPLMLPSMQGGYRLRVEFADGLQLADMKARLIVSRLSNIGEIVATDPPVEDMQSVDNLSQFALIVLTDRNADDVRAIANVDGVKSVQIERGKPDAETVEPDQDDRATTPAAQPGQTESVTEDVESASAVAAIGPTPTPKAAAEVVSGPSDADAEATPIVPTGETSGSVKDHPRPAPSASPDALDRSGKSGVAETLRVGIDRLDQMMNLTGELVVARARISQISNDLDSVFRVSGSFDETGNLGERFRLRLGRIKELFAERGGDSHDWQRLFGFLEEDLDAVDRRLDAWEEGRRQSKRISESVDQLEKVASNLQQSVLDTRMVPVAPLFNRFRRVIRDLASERDKRAELVIHGDKTELDKRMIDELGDPLLHLVRNALDHGLESPQTRLAAGKPETGTITLEATHSGNNVFITIADDGSGLDVDRIADKARDRGLATESTLATMTEQQIIEYIWHPGFSTAEQVSDISGRGVGMDVVKNRIAELSGSIAVETKRGQGTIFKMRLPLTLAIIRCLLVRYGEGAFSIPIDDVHEIVAVRPDQVHSVHGRESIEVRGEYTPLIRMDRVFYWGNPAAHGSGEIINVVILRTGNRTIGLRVDELLGSSDVVIKSLSVHFVSIRGLSGASVMGDGTVCLMLDPTEVINMAVENRGNAPPSLSARPASK